MGDRDRDRGCSVRESSRGPEGGFTSTGGGGGRARYGLTPAEGGKVAVEGDIFLRSDQDKRGAGLDRGIGRGVGAVVCGFWFSVVEGEARGMLVPGSALTAGVVVADEGGAGAGAVGGGGAGIVKPRGPLGIGRSLLGPVGGISPRGPMGKRPP